MSNERSTHYNIDEAPARFLTVENVGRTQKFTPAGYLLCEDVPLARLGMMLYVAEEVPWLKPGKDGLVRVLVTPEMLFSQQTMTSFNGMPVTDGHPEDLVGPTSWKSTAVGTVMNVHRGDAGNSDLLLADMLITDVDAIKAVRDGKREVSCGYDADYIQSVPGEATRTVMVGNHVALTDSGRCGPLCAIGDSHMGSQSFTSKLLSAFKTRDEDAFKKALDDIGDPAPAGVHVHVAGESGGSDMKDIKDMLTALSDRLGAVEKKVGIGGDPPPDDKKAAGDEAVKAKAIADAAEKKIKDDAESEAAAKKKKEEEEEQAAKDAAKKIDDAPLAIKDAAGEDPEGEAAGLGNRSDKGEVVKLTAKDEASAKAAILDTKARAEILVPGIQFPAFDSAQSTTKDSLCTFKRKVLDHAMKKDDKLLKGSDVSKMSCDAVDVAFSFASDAVADKNRGLIETGITTARSMAKETTTQIDAINKKNAEFWGAKK